MTLWSGIAPMVGGVLPARAMMTKPKLKISVATAAYLLPFRNLEPNILNNSCGQCVTFTRRKHIMHAKHTMIWAFSKSVDYGMLIRGKYGTPNPTRSDTASVIMLFVGRLNESGTIPREP